jgi:hypothetical protein
MRRAPRIATVTTTTTTTTSASDAEPSRSEGARKESRVPDANACAQRSRHALRCLLRIVPSGRRSGSGESL